MLAGRAGELLDRAPASAPGRARAPGVSPTIRSSSRPSSCSLSPTCQYSDAAPASSSCASLRIERPCRPSRSSSTSAASTIFSRVSGRLSRGGLGRLAPPRGVRVQPPLTRTVYCARTLFEMTRTVFENAIEADGPRQALRRGAGPRRRRPPRRGRDGVRPAGPQRGRQVHDGAHPHDALAGPTPGPRAWPGIDALKRPVEVRRAIGVVGQKHGSDPEATGRENLVLQAELYGLRRPRAGGRAARALRARRRRRPRRPRPTPAACSGAWTSRSA